MSAVEVMDALSPEYGPFHWEPRYDPASELVYTILSQHTSDINSERAFKNLMDTFDSLEAIAAADVADIEKAIRRAGLFRVKAPRIKQVLNEVLDEVGSFDLSFLAEMPLDEAKDWLKRFNGIGPKTAAIILCFSLGLPAMPVDTHIYRVAQDDSASSARRSQPTRPTTSSSRWSPRRTYSPSTSTSSTTVARCARPYGPGATPASSPRGAPQARHRARLGNGRFPPLPFVGEGWGEAERTAPSLPAS